MFSFDLIIFLGLLSLSIFFFSSGSVTIEDFFIKLIFFNIYKLIFDNNLVPIFKHSFSICIYK